MNTNEHSRHAPSPSLGGRSSDHLRIDTDVANSLQVESSRFSPITPPAPIQEVPSSPIHFWTRSNRNSIAKPPTPPRPQRPPMSQNLDAESGLPVPLPRPNRLRDRLTRILFDLRTFRTTNDPDTLPMHAPPAHQPFLSEKWHQKQPSHAYTDSHTLVGAPEWPPLQIEKRRCPCPNCDDNRIRKKAKKEKRRRIWILILIIIILYLLANTIFLNVKLIDMTTPISPAETSNSTTSTPASLSADAQQCLSEFTLNAPGDPSSYPCSSCLSVLQAVPSAYLSSNPQNGQQITNAIQFCALSSIFDFVDSVGQSQLGTGNWLQDVKFCAWTGVSCDGSGLVSSLELSFPAVPASIPNGIGALSDLTILKLTGNGQVPGGSLPSSFSNLTSLVTLQLQSTGVTALPDTLLQSQTKLTTLTLVENAQMGSSLPSSLTSSSLEDLIVNNQTLSNPLSALSESSSLQSSLKLLDLSSTGLTGSIPTSISSLTGLTELHLDSNSLTGSLPSLPSTLQVLTLQGNSALSGSPPTELCSDSALQSCTLTGTGLTAPSGGCGVCELGS